jgi:hypothetical protein
MQIQSGECKLPLGWRLIERWGPRFKDIERWVVEDDYAGDEFEGCLVSPIFKMTLIDEGPDYTVEVSEREILPSRY